MEKMTIFKVIEDSELHIRIDQKLYKGTFLIKARIMNKEKNLYDHDLATSKDEALFKIQKIKLDETKRRKERESHNGPESKRSLDQQEENDKEDLEKIEKFLSLMNYFEEIKNIENSLLSYGYIYFKEYSSRLSIKNGELGEIRHYYQKRKMILTKWKE